MLTDFYIDTEYTGIICNTKFIDFPAHHLRILILRYTNVLIIIYCYNAVALHWKSFISYSFQRFERC